MNLINQFAFYLFSLTSHRAINKKWKWNSPQRVKRCRFSRTFWVAAASRLLTLPRQQHPMMQTPHFALSKMIIRKASQSLRWNYHSFAPSIFTIHHQVHDRQPQLSHTFSTTKKCAYIGCSVLSSSWSRWQVALVVATHSPRLIALLQRLMAFSCHPHPQRQRQFRKQPKHCLHCSNGLAKYGRVGVYWPGLGLCRESAVGNKTIAMNCLRIMLGINPPHSQTIQSNENLIISSYHSRSLTFSGGKGCLETCFLFVGHFLGYFYILVVGPVWVSWSDVCEWRAENYLLSLPGPVTPTPPTHSDRPTILRPTSLNTPFYPHNLDKHRKNCECCPVSLLIVRSQRLSCIQVLNCQNFDQCLKCHKSLGLSLKLSKW